MEEGWERPPRMELGREELARLVEPAFPGRRLAEHSLLMTGLANTNLRFRLEGDDETYVLRVHTRDPSAARRERELMTYLAAHPNHGIPLAPLVYSQPDAEPGGYAHSVWRFVEGTLLQELFGTLPPSELVAIARECGKVLAALSKHRFERCGEFGTGMRIERDYGRPSAFVPHAVHRALFGGRAGTRLGPGLRDELWRVVERTSPRLRAIDDRYTLVHADFKRSNLLLQCSSAGWKVAAVLDWEFACAGPPLIDVGLFLRAGAALPAGFRDAFAAGYAGAGGELPRGWLPLSRLVDLLSQLTFLNDPEEKPNVFAETTAVVRETIEVLS